MSIEQMEARIEAMEKRLKAQEKRISDLEDIEAIKRLQRAYNYFVEHMLGQDIIDCFSDSSDVELRWLEGTWKGKEGVKRYFARIASEEMPSGFSHQLMPSGGLITLAPDGKTAKGRWYVIGGVFMSDKGKVEDGAICSGIYEMGYVKEGGVWKIMSINWVIPWSARIPEWKMPEDIGRMFVKGSNAVSQEEFRGPDGEPMPVPDIPLDVNDLRYVSGYIFPFHFKHPVTGKDTTEATGNARLEPLKVE
jgi:hypothetical protein